jgi:hypothetical protein
MISGWVSFLAYPNLFGINDFVVVVVVVVGSCLLYEVEYYSSWQAIQYKIQILY